MADIQKDFNNSSSNSAEVVDDTLVFANDLDAPANSEPSKGDVTISFSRKTSLLQAEEGDVELRPVPKAGESNQVFTLFPILAKKDILDNFFEKSNHVKNLNAQNTILNFHAFVILNFHTRTKVIYKLYLRRIYLLQNSDVVILLLRLRQAYGVEMLTEL